MLPVENRLIKKEDFNKTYQKGKVFSGENVSIKVVENKTSYTRIGFSIGKNFFKKAVDRNKIKRKLREITRSYLEEIRPGFDVVVFCKKEGIFIQKSGFLKAKKEIKELFKKAKLLKN
jgi:ribonuclease P protein component